MSALTYTDVSFSFPPAIPALDRVQLGVEPGELFLLVGPSGSGKSTLLRTTNGLVPHSTGGRLDGEVVVFGRSTRTHRPRELADVVGFVHQDPEAQFVVDRVDVDVAFALENLGVAPALMRTRVDEALEAVGVTHLRDRAPDTLSGGERQRVAIAGALAAAPQALVLDEPTSQLDPQGADDVLAAIARLNADEGLTVLLAEHRLERVARLADRAARLDEGRIVDIGATASVVAGYEGAPAVTRLGTLLGWDPPPLSVKESRAHAAPLLGVWPPPVDEEPAPGPALVTANGLRVELRGREVLHGVNISLCAGEVVALLGRNGAGKTTLLRALAGLIGSDGTIAVSATLAYVPQDPGTLLTAATVRGELETTQRLLRRRDRDAVEMWIDRLGLHSVAERHPRALAGGQRQRVAVAAVAVGGADVLLLDEPTRGMDAPSRHALEAAVRDHAAEGGAVVLATHDMELAARVASRVILLDAGDMTADGRPRDVLAGTRFAPQTWRVLPPFLTVEEVAVAHR